eukprot:5545113-Prymnesium_polylepis.2
MPSAAVVFTRNVIVSSKRLALMTSASLVLGRMPTAAALTESAALDVCTAAGLKSALLLD